MQITVLCSPNKKRETGMFNLSFKTPAQVATDAAKAAQEQTFKVQNLVPVNDDTAEEKYHHRFFGRDDAAV